MTDDAAKLSKDPETRQVIKAFERVGWKLESMGGGTTAFRATSSDGKIEFLLGQEHDACIPLYLSAEIQIGAFDIEEEVELDSLTGYTADDALISLRERRGDVMRWLEEYGYGFGGSAPRKNGQRRAPAKRNPVRIGETRALLAARYRGKMDATLTHYFPVFPSSPNATVYTVCGISSEAAADRHATDISAAPTCPRCLRMWEREHN